MDILGKIEIFEHQLIHFRKNSKQLKKTGQRVSRGGHVNRVKVRA